MSRVFSDILSQGLRAGQIPERTQEARDWYREATRMHGSKIRQGGVQAGRVDYARYNEKKFLNEDQSRLTTKVYPGHMYFFMYDAKWKDELPYWDKFPLIFPFNVQKDRFWCMNFHYLPLTLRAKLCDNLYDLANNKRFDETTKLNLSYKVLNSASKYKEFKPTIHCYLFSHMRSPFMRVHPTEWSIATFLPLQRFQKATATKVWADSKRKLGI